MNLVGKTGQAIEISIHFPTEYICANRERILPGWKNKSFLWVAIVLQQSRYELVECTVEAEAEKEHLREQFMRFGFDIAFNLHSYNYFTDLIDPRTGYPLLSSQGKIPHDDAAVVKALLDYPIIKNKCCVLVHPDWGAAVYPSILISEAPPIMMEWVINRIAPLHGWKKV